MTTTLPVPAAEQLTLDTICDRVIEKCHMGYIGFSIGWRDNVAQYVAKKTKQPVEVVRDQVAKLISANLLSDNFVTDDCFEIMLPGMLGLTHESWLAYSRLDRDRVSSEHGLDDDGGFDAWLEWDGIDGTTFGGDFDPPFEPKRAKLIVGRLYCVAWQSGGETSKAFVRFIEDKQPYGVVVKGPTLYPNVQHVRTQVLRHGQLIPVADEPGVVALMERQAAEVFGS